MDQAFVPNYRGVTLQLKQFDYAKDYAMKHVDMVVIGSGPAGQKAAIQAAKLGKQVALVERNPIIGGVCTHTGTIPSKALREAVLQLAGLAAAGLLRAGRGGQAGNPH